jgi:hypothetical protein
MSASLRFASDDTESWLLNDRNELFLARGVGVVKDARATFIEGHRDGVHARQFLDQGRDGFGTAAAVHAFDLQRDGFHVIAPDPMPFGHSVVMLGLGLDPKVKRGHCRHHAPAAHRVMHSGASQLVAG